MNTLDTRRVFLQQLATATGGVILMPLVSCATKSQAGIGGSDAVSIPSSRPNNWDPIAFNKIRGNAGAIPASYHESINGPEGDLKHLGKHLPFVPSLDAARVPAGYVALMWGDPSKGYAKHPNAAKEADTEGHWYDWIRIQNTSADSTEMQSEYPTWPGTSEERGFAVLGGGDITAESGKNTIYLAALPKDAAPGDTLRIHAHCLTHGEYVDFITLT